MGVVLKDGTVVCDDQGHASGLVAWPLMASHAVVLLKASLRSVHPASEVEELSTYSIELEIQQTYQGMMIALRRSDWLAFSTLSTAQLATLLHDLAHHVDLAPRVPMPPTPKKTPYANGGHVSKHKLLREPKK